MKKLTLTRHAKSSWEHNVIDHERPLNDRGSSDAVLLANEFKNSFIQPDLLISSDANRAKTTANIFIETLNISSKIVRYNHSLYDFSGRNLVEVIKNCDESVNHLWVFGHNHAITYFVNTYGNVYIDNVPTCGIVQIEFDINDWKNLKKGKTLMTLFPRNLKD